MTKLRKSTPERKIVGEGLTFYSPEEVTIAFNEERVDLNAGIKVRTYDIDEEGNSSICTANVTVVDDTPPIVDCPNDIFVQLEPGECEEVVLFDIPFTDN